MAVYATSNLEEKYIIDYMAKNKPNKHKSLENKLKPCPFCGSTKVYLSELDGEYPVIECEYCFAAVSNPPDKETLIEIWNRRI